MVRDSTAASNVPPPPWAHAVGGSLGSALALILFYPLERARIEMQQAAATVQRQSRPVLPSRVEMAPSLMEGSQSSDNLFDTRTSTDADITTTQQISPTGSWVETDPANSITGEDGEMMGGTHQEQVPDDTQSQGVVSSDTKRRKGGLLACLVQLRERGELYQGVTPVVLTMAISNFVFFYMHALIKKMMIPSLAATQQGKNFKKNSMAMSLIASSLAGVVNVLMTNPLWVANLRIVTGKGSSNSLFRVMRDIWQQEGLAHLWNGTGTSLMLVSNPVIQFFCYEQLKIARLLMTSAADTAAGSLDPMDAFILGAFAKAVSTVSTYPLQLTQTLLRVQKSNHHQQQQQQPPSDGEQQQADNSNQTVQFYSGTMDCLVKLYKEKGIEGWFAGMRPKMLQTVLTAAFTFLTYEQILRVVHAAHLTLIARKLSPTIAP